MTFKSPVSTVRFGLTFASIILSLFAAQLPVFAEDQLTLKLPDNRVVTGTLVTMEPFNQQDAWEAYSSPKGVELGIEDGVYRMFTMNEGYVWGLNDEQHDNVIVEAEITPMSADASDNAFGVMCRADESNNGDGYYFMIKGDGYYSISVGVGNAIKPLVEWQPSKAIHAGIDKNRVRVMCADDNLALYVNDELMIETQDTTYSRGYTGLSIAAAPNSSSDVAFDNVAIYRVSGF
ncbi:MAG: DUF1080 domain-containing protein [Chloroflexi bacterium]|nr:DUF1080 domain-containing protein [Chloroflexota bacterium]MCC6891411.1 hypothetical protein [Anaerolineae bacterium]